MHISNFIKAGVFVFLLCFAFSVNAQPAWTYDLFGKEKKPEKYEEKLLPSEMSATKKFGFKRKFIQNGISHYNFYFNANNKLNAVLERASLSNKDDYSKLLNFYSYSLDNTASQKTELDSVIYKSTAGILLHDLRSAWVDNFYLLIGKSYYLKKDFDSAALTFQFINYNLFPRKKKNDDDNKIVGSNEVTNGVGSVSIANKENRNILQKTFTLAPSRNDALIWLAKTFIQQNELGDAAGLISILQNDKNLPLRLKNDLEEVTSYWFFVQNNYDSAAIHLENALSNADTKADKSRWQFLLAQMFEISGKYDDAEKYYAKASTKTNDPIMDIYARLNSAKMLRNGANSKELDNSIDKLLRMAKKDKYDGFADIIYYSAAQLSLQKNDTTNGIGLFKKSILKNIEGSSYKDKSFLQLGNIAYNQRDYILAHAYYDSISIAASILNVDSATLADRKDILGRLAPYLLEVEKQDSLQMVAALPENERTIFIKKLVKKYRKENGLKEDVELGGTELITFSNNRNEPIDIFKSSTSNGGQWYFYNASLRAKGYNDFKNKWGKRTNSDNWRRKSATSNANNGFDLNNNLDPNAPIKTEDEVKEDAKKENFSYDGLMANLPLTKELIDSSNGIMAKNILLAAQIFQNELQDYEQAIHTYDEFVNRFANNEKIADAYVGLAFCYEKLGNTTKSNFYKNILKNTFANTVAAKLLDNPSAKNK
ncbi:MAG: tetratricopeptide repeat protein, partial [Ferruginibacter sp.]